jgi:cytochrome P450
MVCTPSIIKEIFKHPRKDPENGLFNDTENLRIYLPLLQDLYPDETIGADDSLLTCHKHFVNFYRQPLLRFMGPLKIKGLEFELQKIIEEILDFQMLQDKNLKIDATELSLLFVSNVVSKLLLGHPGPLKTYKEIAYAIDYMNKYAMKKVWRQPISTTEKEKYEHYLNVVRQAIEICLQNVEKDSLVETLIENPQMTLLQVKSTLFLMYFAGVETAGSLLNYLLWQLGQNKVYQEKIFEEIKDRNETFYEIALHSNCIDKLFNESIRLFTPSYVMGRQLSTDLICKIKDERGNIRLSEKICQKDQLLCGVTFTARDPQVYTNPDQFNPDRFEALPKTLPWLPFGDGRHACPGQWLAKAEITSFVAGLVKKYRIQSFPSEEIGQKGYMTLKLDRDVSLFFTFRNR